MNLLSQDPGGLTDTGDLTLAVAAPHPSNTQAGDNSEYFKLIISLQTDHLISLHEWNKQLLSNIDSEHFFFQVNQTG